MKRRKQRKEALAWLEGQQKVIEATKAEAVAAIAAAEGKRDELTKSGILYRMQRAKRKERGEPDAPNQNPTEGAKANATAAHKGNETNKDLNDEPSDMRAKVEDTKGDEGL